MAQDPDITLDQDAEAAAEAKAQSLDKPVEIPGYQLSKRLGAGTFGEVWSAVQIRTGQEVAVKLLHKTNLGSQEMERLRKVSEHPHIVTLLDADMEATPPYLVMSLMRESLDSQERHDPEKVLSWFRQMVQALHFVHERGLLHCDLKPSNVLTDGTENVRLADFGQSVALEQSSGAFGSLGYMSPEQAAEPEFPSVHWDVYSLGATTYTLLTNRLPRLRSEKHQELREVSDPKARLSKYVTILKSEPLIPIRKSRPEVPKDFALLVERCLEVSQESRTPSAEYILEDLKRLGTGEPLLCQRPWSKTYLAACFFRRHALAILACVLLLIGLSVAGFVRYRAGIQMQTQLAAQQRERARSLTDDGFGQRGLLWGAESLKGAPGNSAVSLQVERFSPQLEQVLDFATAPDTVSFSPDGKSLAAGSATQLLVWNSDGEITRRIGEVPLESPGADRPYDRVQQRVIWNDQTELRAVLQNKLVHHADETQSGNLEVLAASSDIFVLQEDGRVVLQSPKSQYVLPGVQELEACCVGNEGLWVLGSDGEKLSLWTKDGDEQVWTIPLDHRVTHLSAHPDGTKIAAALGNNKIEVRAVADGALLKSIPTGRWAIYSVHFSPDGSRMFACDAGGRVRVWETEKFEEWPEVIRHQWLVYGLEFDSTGEHFATFSVDGTARVWETRTGHALTPFLEHQSPVRCANFDPSGDRLITGALDGVIRVFRLRSSDVAQNSDPNLAITEAKFLPGTERCLVVLGDVALEGTLSGRELGKSEIKGSARLYDSLSKEPNWRRDFPEPVTAASVSDSGTKLFLGFQDGSVVSLKATDGRSSWEDDTATVRVTSMAVNNQEDRLAVAFEDGTSLLYTITDDGFENLQSLDHEGKKKTTQTTHPTHLSFHPKGHLLLTALGDEEVRVWNATDGSLQKVISRNAPIRYAEFSPNGDMIAIAEDNGQATVWSLDGEQIAAPFSHEIAIWSLAFSPDNKLLASASGDSTCRIWNLQTNSMALTALEHGAPVVRVKFSPDGRWLLTGAKDGVARLWDTTNGELVLELLEADAPVFALDFQTESDLLVAGSGDGKLHRMRLDLEEKRTTKQNQQSAERKTGLRLTVLPGGDSLVTALRPSEWKSLSSDASSSN